MNGGEIMNIGVVSRPLPMWLATASSFHSQDSLLQKPKDGTQCSAVSHHGHQTVKAVQMDKYVIFLVVVFLKWDYS